MAQIGSISIDNGARLVLIAGPCVIEEETVFVTAAALERIAEELKIALIFKASYDKANRQSLSSSRGVGIKRGLEILKEIKARHGLPILTDVHLPAEVESVADVADCLQIPAFLCRQTDLVVAAAETGRTINIKKGQFLAPDQMRSIVEKARDSGAKDILVTERGATFGYNDLVFDPRSVAVMKDFAPVIFDATHSVQKPGAAGTGSGGDRHHVPVVAAAAVALGIAGLFIETHPDPASAQSDRETQWPLADFSALIARMLRIDSAVKS